MADQAKHVASEADGVDDEWRSMVCNASTLMMQMEQAERLALHSNAPAGALAHSSLVHGPIDASATLLMKLARRGYAQQVAVSLAEAPEAAQAACEKIADDVSLRRLVCAAPETVSPTLSPSAAASVAARTPSSAHTCASIAAALQAQPLASAASTACNELCKAEHSPSSSFRLAVFVCFALTRPGVSLDDQSVEAALRSVSMRLSSSDSDQLALAKAIGNLLAHYLAPQQDAPFAGDSDAERYCDALRGGCWPVPSKHDTRQVHTDTEANQQAAQNNSREMPAANAHDELTDIGYNLDEEEDESLPVYELNEDAGESASDEEESEAAMDAREAEEGPAPSALYSKGRGAAWVGELIEELGKADDPDAVERALDDAHEVISCSGPELNEYAERLVATLIRARPATPREERVSSNRLRALAASLFSAPLQMPEHMLELALEEDWGLDLSQRIECLCSIPPALVQLGQRRKDRTGAHTNSSETATLAHSEASDDAVHVYGTSAAPAPLRTVGKTIRASEISLARWRRERAEEMGTVNMAHETQQQFAFVNEASHVAPYFLYPLLDKLCKATDRNPCISEASVLTRALQVAAVIHATAGYSPHRRDMAYVTLEALDDKRLERRASEDVHINRMYWHLALECVAGLSRGELHGMLEESNSKAPELLRSIRSKAKSVAAAASEAEVTKLASLCARSLDATVGALTDAALLLSGSSTAPSHVPSDVPSALRICV